MGIRRIRLLYPAESSLKPAQNLLRGIRAAFALGRKAQCVPDHFRLVFRALIQRSP